MPRPTWRSTIAVVLVASTACTAPSVHAQRRPSPAPAPPRSSKLLRQVMGEIHAADPEEAVRLRSFLIDATGSTSSTARINLGSPAGFPPGAWRRVILPAVARIADAFGHHARYGGRLVVDAMAPFWNGYDDPLVGTHLWKWSRSSLAPYLRCRGRARVGSVTSGDCRALLWRLSTVSRSAG